MRRVVVIVMLICVWSVLASGQTTNHQNKRDRRIEEEIKRLYEHETDLILRGDVAGMDRFYPDDFVVTNPFNQFINKQKVLERVRTNIIKYKSYERHFDCFRVYGDTVLVIGSETVIPTADANRPDAGETVHRRFTEVWMLRKGQWRTVARHAHNIVP